MVLCSRWPHGVRHCSFYTRRMEFATLWVGQAISCINWDIWFGGQVFLTKAIQIEKAGLVALMKTLEVVFAFIFQITFFNKVPSWWTVGGSLCVIASSTGAAIRKWYQSSH